MEFQQTKNKEHIIFGEKQGIECPVCKKIYDEFGDMNNPCINIIRREICEDCGNKLNILLQRNF